MAKSHRIAGQVNLKGKRSRLLNCKCCEVKDLRLRIELKRLRNELRVSGSKQHDEHS